MNINVILENRGPSLSSEISKLLQSEGASPQAARQKISRARGDVKRLDNVNFPNREKFLYLSKQYKSPKFKTNLTKALTSTNSSYGLILKAIRLRSGYLPINQAPIYSGLSTSRTKGHILFSTALAWLKKMDLVTEHDEVLTIPFYATDKELYESIKIVENITLDIYKEWLIKTGLVSFNKVALRSDNVDQPKVGQFEWCLSAPSYLAAIVKKQKKTNIKPGFIVGDIALGGKINLQQLRFFFNKWDAFAYQRRATKLQPLIIVDSLTKEALSLLRQKGCIIALPENFLGKEAAAALRELISTIKNAALAVTKNPTEVFNLLKRISKLEGSAFNLRGVVFEFIIAHLYQIDGYNIDLRYIVSDGEGKEAEVDVKAKKPQNIILVECKGMAPGNLVGEEILCEWVDKSLERIRSWIKLKNQLLPQKKEIHFYSSTGYTSEAKEIIRKLEKAKKVPIKFYDGPEVLSLLKKKCDKAVTDIFKEQFIIK